MSEEKKYVRLLNNSYGEVYPPGTLVRYSEVEEVDGTVVVHAEDPIYEDFKWIFAGDFEHVDILVAGAATEVEDLPKIVELKKYKVQTTIYVNSALELHEVLDDLTEKQLRHTTVDNQEVK